MPSAGASFSPAVSAGRIVNLYGRSIGAAFPHRLLPRSKGGLFAWESVGSFSTVHPGRRAVRLGRAVAGRLSQHHLRHRHPADARSVASAFRAAGPLWSIIVFDQDENQAGQQASHQLAQRLANVGVPPASSSCQHGHDPNSYFVAGATAADFTDCLQQAHPL